MSAWFANPAWVLIIGGLLLPLFGYRLRCVLLLILPVIAGIWLVQMPATLIVETELLGHTLTPLRLDGLSFVFALIFLIATFLTGLFMLASRGRLEPAATLVYAGAAVAATLAGDLLTLFIYWEITALASTLIIWANGPQAWRVGLRYLIIQVSSGLLLLTGALVYFNATGSLEFAYLGLDTPGGWLIFFAFGIKAAFPFLHNWLQDAYPEASPAGTVALSAFTTKLAIYALARGYAGTDILIPVGALMTLFPIFYALIENDLRRVLAYSLNIQLGFMVVGIGIGTELALNGTAAHAFTHVLYKSLLFMAMGAVLYRAGTVKGSELGGLYKSMPWTLAFCVIGAASISAVPLFSGFVSKSLILGAAGYQGLGFIWLVLIIASAAALQYVGLKVPYFAFFNKDSGIRCQEAPLNMLLAMGITAALCIGIGIFPGLLYAILPHAVDYQPYTAGHILSQTQLLVFSALAFAVLIRSGIYPDQQRSTNLDSDWVYRRIVPMVVEATSRFMERVLERFGQLGQSVATVFTDSKRQPGRSRPVSVMALWVAVVLAAMLLFGIG